MVRQHVTFEYRRYQFAVPRAVVGSVPPVQPPQIPSCFAKIAQKFLYHDLLL
jgi:hypothetical protein